MADTKISEFASVTGVLATDIVPVVQDSLNKKATAGQLRTYITAPIVSAIVAAAVPLTSTVVELSGNCTLAAGSGNQELKFITTGAGKLSSVGLLPSDGFTFGGAGCTLAVIWSSAKWNILSVNGMTSGII